jgi:hypothetical protein
VPGGDAPHLDVLLELAGQIEQPEVVGDGGAVEAHPLTDLLLGQAVVDQRAEGVGQLHGIQVVALNVLDEGEFEAILAFNVGDDGGNRLAASGARSAPAPLAHDELVAIARAPDHDGLKDAVKPDRIGEAIEFERLEAAPRLLGIGIDQVDGYLRRAVTGGPRRPRFDRGVCGSARYQGAEAAPERVSPVTHRHLRTVPPSVVAAARVMRALLHSGRAAPWRAGGS